LASLQRQMDKIVEKSKIVEEGESELIKWWILKSDSNTTLIDPNTPRVE
jgi:hypothetical protein